MKQPERIELQVKELVDVTNVDYAYKGPLMGLVGMGMLIAENMFSGGEADFSKILIGVCTVGVIVFISAIAIDAYANK